MSKLVVIESPFAAQTDSDHHRNITYLREALADSINRGEAPFASHALYPLVLDDEDQAQRTMGINLGFAWGSNAQLVAVYGDLGVTAGMQRGIQHYSDLGILVETRTLGPDWVNFSR